MTKRNEFPKPCGFKVIETSDKVKKNTALVMVGSSYLESNFVFNVAVSFKVLETDNCGLSCLFTSICEQVWPRLSLKHNVPK
jgi:hypothetical protein